MSLAFSVVDDQLIFGTEEDVEQAIRDFKSQNFESLASDPMYQRVTRHLPSRAGLFFYENSRDNTEQTWWMLKTMAKEKPDYKENKPYNHPIDQPMQSCHYILSCLIEGQNRSKSNKIETKITIFGLKSP